MIVKNINRVRRYLTYGFRVLTGKKVITYNQIQIELNKYNKSCKRLLLFNSWEKDEIKLLAKYISKNDSIIEFGTGIGVLSAVCVKKFGIDNIVTIEANPNNLGLINDLYKLNNIEKIQLLNNIIGEKEVYDFYCDDNIISSSQSFKPDSEKVVIKGLSFNNLIENYPYNFLVMDIEGGEYELLTNNELPSFVNKLLIEFHGIDNHSTSKDNRYIVIQEKLKKDNFLLLAKEGRTHYYQKK